MRRIVVVGASAAGLGVAESLRRDGHDGPVVLVGEEAHLPYDRPPLSKQVLKGDWAVERVRLRDRAVLDAAGVELVLGARAVGLDTEACRVALSDGRTVAYDALVVATGVRPRPLPAPHDEARVHTVRTRDDAVALAAALRSARSVVVVGAGFLGIEIAAVAREMGLQVHVVDVATAPMAQLGPIVAARVARLHTHRGVALYLGVGVCAVEHTARGPRVHLTDGSALDTDVVVVAVGSLPNTDWLTGSDVPVEDGVVCDEFCMATPAVAAAGDVARWFHRGHGRHVRVEHRMNATEQARAVARSLLGHREPYVPTAYFWTDQYDVRIQVYGEPAHGDVLEVIEGDLDDDRFAALYRRDARVVAGLAWNLPRAARAIRQEVLQAAPAGPP